jgi:hypothetical protein
MTDNLMIQVSRQQLEYWRTMLLNGLPETVASMIQTVLETKADAPKYPNGHYKCLACGGLHPGLGNLPCPKMSPMSGASE